jgi:Bacterial Ig-like domain (group 1)
MNLRKFLFALSISLTIIHLSASAQRDSIALTSIIDKTSKYTTGHPVEKVFLHFDKPYYAVGDTIWVKAYVTTDLHIPSLLSKIVYIDFTDGQNNIVAEQKLQLINGIANSFVPLPGIYVKPGNYHVRAYTRWMRNFDQAYFFNKTISIGSADEGQVIPRIAFKNSITDKISKVSATVFYKDQEGKPYANKKVSWKVTNDEDNIQKGKGETDADGKFEIAFSTDKSAALNSAVVVTDLEMDDKKVISKTFPLETTVPGIDVQFFPEGGYLISGVRSRVAFKAIKPDGLGIDAKGTITDNAGTVVADFTSQHLGMGIFALMPESNKTYKANLTFADGTQSSFDLPTPRDEGINISLNNSNKDTLSIKIATNEPFFQKNQNKTFYVIAQSNGIICYAAQTVLKNAVYAANVPKDKFPTGIVQVTVFSSKGAPLSERIVFIRHDDLLNLTLKSDRPSYLRRQKVSMTVLAKNKALPAQGSFSVSVVNESLVPSDDDAETTILSHLLITSDLRGYIEKPNYYFAHTDDKANTDLDVLMLTQGYRRFSYKNIMTGKIPPITYLPEQGIEITGILRSNTGIPISKGSVSMLIPDKNFSSRAVTDANGYFRFGNVLVSDSSKVTLSARDNTNGSLMVLTVDPVLSPPSTQYMNPTGGLTNIDSTIHAYLQNSKKQLNALAVPRTLKEVVIKANANEGKVSHQDFPTLSGLGFEADHTIPGDRFKDCPVFSQCLGTAAMGLTYDNNNLYVTRDYNNGKRVPVQIFVSGMEVDYNYLDNVNPKMVESVEIFLTDGVSGINQNTNTKGVLEVNMKKVPKGEKISKEQLMDMMPKPYVVTITPGGFNASKLFYSPKYNNPATANIGVDLRSTIYWNPMVLTDTNGNASFNFFNADGQGTYRAVIQGIDKDGNIGWYVYRYKVQ